MSPLRVLNVTVQLRRLLTKATQLSVRSVPRVQLSVNATSHQPIATLCFYQEVYVKIVHGPGFGEVKLGVFVSITKR